MTSNSGDFYILQDGTQAAPGDCSEGKDGVLRHENGLKVLLDSEGNPLTVQKNAEEGGAALAAEHGRAAAEGESLMTTENQAVAPEAPDEKPADQRPAPNRVTQAMMPEPTPAPAPAPAPKPEGKGKEPKAE